MSIVHQNHYSFSGKLNIEIAMKNQIYIILGLLLVSIYSCESDNIKDKFGQKIIMEEEPIRYSLQNCAINEEGVLYAGYKCVPGAQCAACIKEISCTLMKDDDGNKIPLVPSQPHLLGWGFSEAEILAWINGVEFLNDTTPESIEQRYELYLYLWQQGITLHPDTIIMMMEGE